MWKLFSVYSLQKNTQSSWEFSYQEFEMMFAFCAFVVNSKWSRPIGLLIAKQLWRKQSTGKTSKFCNKQIFCMLLENFNKLITRKKTRLFGFLLVIFICYWFLFILLFVIDLFVICCVIFIGYWFFFSFYFDWLIGLYLCKVLLFSSNVHWKWSSKWSESFKKRFHLPVNAKRNVRYLVVIINFLLPRFLAIFWFWLLGFLSLCFFMWNVLVNRLQRFSF